VPIGKNGDFILMISFDNEADYDSIIRIKSSLLSHTIKDSKKCVYCRSVYEETCNHRWLYVCHSGFLIKINKITSLICLAEDNCYETCNPSSKLQNWIQMNFYPNPDGPANYRGSNISAARYNNDCKRTK
jgi:hypothetical protein